MKKIILFISIQLASSLLFAQPGNDTISNSFSEYFKTNNPNLEYAYDEKLQVHDYSGNWDLDGDGKKDRLLFIGNGGAHLYFHVRIILSSDHSIKDFPFLLLDMPIPGKVEDLVNSDRKYPLLPQFVVYDFDSDGVDEIYFNMDLRSNPIPAKLKKQGLHSRYMLLKYKNKKMVLRNFSRTFFNK